MSRIIKFRAWDNESSEWIYSKPMPDMSFWKWVQYDSTTIFNESTGLKDRHGVEIFEGDLVKWGHLEGWSYETETRVGEVKLAPDLQFDVKNIKIPHVFHFGNFAYHETHKYLEVIGNVYSNPELLEQPNEPR